ncbi:MULTISPECIES: CinA family protein [Acinetobacter]|uniref:CinA family protein n=1 Tax=Acinetobacter TaxID=469 RepID=UPI00141B85AE|nr:MULTISPECIES: CinA family protein [Acinetobacter]MCS4296842.1 nicotinamide-nucleotide amidase [Acinetobacter guillouiae]MCW2250964.1 nicotinamide-nucleotide amidase [Acinetobacter sp. BIGb0204]MDN5489801.1 CinA family protein [Acinetobacter sp.]NII36938.1 nicotinamide-nucleotide amidase [Acinetobacter sp. BIGb0196]
MLLKQCCDLLERKNLTVAFIESASSGYLSSQFSIYKNSGADILLGGLVSYDPSIKISILQIDPSLIEKYSAESVEVTKVMAIQGKKLFTAADIVVSCTGLLKPGGSASIEKPEGTFFISIHYQNTLSNFKYFIEGEPLTRLNQLTENVAKEILKILNFV